MSKLLKLSLLQEISLAMNFLSTNKEDLRTSSGDLLKQKIPEFLDSFNELGIKILVKMSIEKCLLLN